MIFCARAEVSKLEFALSDLTFWGVGRIHSLYMYPMSFDEFLLANDENALIAIKKEASPEKPIILPFHEKLKEYLKFYLNAKKPANVRLYPARCAATGLFLLIFLYYF